MFMTDKGGFYNRGDPLGLGALRLHKRIVDLRFIRLYFYQPFLHI